MKVVRVFLVLIFAFFSTVNAQEIKAKRLKTKKTQEHINVTGTNLYLKVPEGYQQSVTYVGWQKKDASAIVISKRPRTFKEVSDEIDQHLINLGYDIKSAQKKRLLLNANDAVYFETKNDSLEKQFLIIKVTDFAYVIEASYNSNNNNGKALKKTLLNAFIEN